MARPKQGYKLLDGTRVPGVTTIIGRYKESGGLIHWAWEQGRDGKDYRESRDAAATAGHVAHEMIEAQILGRETMLDPTWDRDALDLGAAAYAAFVTWAQQSHLKIACTETAIVSELHRYGGTLDAMGWVNGKLNLVDWKTSNRIYPDYLIQLAAYQHLFEDDGGDELHELVGGKRIEGFHLLRVGKDLGDFHHHYWPRAALAPAWEAFLHMRALYEIDAQLKKAVG